MNHYSNLESRFLKFSESENPKPQNRRFVYSLEEELTHPATKLHYFTVLSAEKVDWVWDAKGEIYISLVWLLRERGKEGER